MKKITLIAAALAAVNAFAITATKEYVDNATNATLAASKSYTDQAVAGCVPGNYETVSNRAMNAVQTETDPTAYSKITNAVQSGYLCTVESAQAMTNRLIRSDSNNVVTFDFKLTDDIGNKIIERDVGLWWFRGWADCVMWSGVSGKPTTLSGYGITDAYTKTEVDGIVSNKENKITAGTGIVVTHVEGLLNYRFSAEGSYHYVKQPPSRPGDPSPSVGTSVQTYSDEACLVEESNHSLENIGSYEFEADIFQYAGLYAVVNVYSLDAPAPASTTVSVDGNYISSTSVTNGGAVAEAKAYTDSANATTRAIVATWENFLDGSNVVFSITNYISGTYNLDAAKLRIMEMTNGVYREVYNSRDEILLHINDFKNTDFCVATNQVIQGVSAAIADKADKAWGKYTSAGGEAPSNTVYMTAPNTVFAGGMEYERVAVGEGSVCILTTKGAPVYTQGDEGTFKFQDDGGTNYFGFAKTDSYVIGANASGISVQNQIVTINYDVTMSGVPCIWYKQAIESAVEWEQLNLPDGTPVAGASHVVSWDATPPAGRETCYINCPEAKGFFKATIEVPGSAKFMTNMPADFSGGILCTDGEHKVKINWNNGAPTLVPAN